MVAFSTPDDLLLFEVRFRNGTGSGYGQGCIAAHSRPQACDQGAAIIDATGANR
jgi:hypothetical protein